MCVERARACVSERERARASLCVLHDNGVDKPLTHITRAFPTPQRVPVDLGKYASKLEIVLRAQASPAGPTSAAEVAGQQIIRAALGSVDSAGADSMFVAMLRFGNPFAVSRGALGMGTK